jgi:L-asparaginase II
MKVMKPIQVYRGQYLESSHSIHVAVVDKDGRLLYFYGDPERMTFPRSSLKPFQAIPLIETGAADSFSYDNAEIAIACASHAGELFHQETILRILERLGIQEDNLQCGTHTPWNLESYKELLRKGKDVTPVFSNCSGKHAGMLAAAIHMKEDIATYREVEHPHQQRILEAIATICDFPKEKIKLSVDGCGVPVHQLPLYNAALGYARLANPDSIKSVNRIDIVKRIRDSMVEFPEMVGGTNRFDTDLMKAYKGRIVSKAGAEAVQCMGLIQEGIGIAIKVEDGGTRAVNVAAMEVLNQLGYKEVNLFTNLDRYVHAPVLNARKEKIGEIRANFHLEEALSTEK